MFQALLLWQEVLNQWMVNVGAKTELIVNINQWYMKELILYTERS